MALKVGSIFRVY